MTTTAKIGIAAAAAVLLGVGGWLAFGRDRDEMPAGSPAAPALAASDSPQSKPPLPLAASGRAKSTGVSPTPSPADPPIAAVPAARSEPTLAQIDALATPTSFDVIAGVILGTSGPVAGVQVTSEGQAVSAERAQWIHERGADVNRVRSGMGRSDSEGAFSLPDMLFNTYMVFVQGDGITRRGFRLSDRGDPNPARRRVVVVLGDGVVEGTVFDRAGVAASQRAVRLRFSSSPRPAQPSETLETTTLEDGSFRFTRVRAGTWQLIATLDSSAPNFPDERDRVVTMNAGVTIRADLGASQPDRVWRGTARLSSGAVLRSSAITVNETKLGTLLTLHTDAEGRFDQRLPDGTYSAGAVDGQPLFSRPPEIVVSGRDFDADLDLPGVRVSGVVRRASSVEDATRPAAWDFEAFQSKPPSASRNRIPRVTVAKDGSGSFAIVGVTAGTWKLIARDLSGLWGRTVHADEVPTVEREVEVTDRDVEGLVLELTRR